MFEQAQQFRENTHRNGYIQELDRDIVDQLKPILRASKGNLMPEPVQEKMEAVFGTDFSDVRIHESMAAVIIGAIAFTKGNNIYFAPGMYDPWSERGQMLLGHELAHVLQQRAGRVRGLSAQLLSINAEPALEAEADLAGEKAAWGEAVEIIGIERATNTQGSDNQAPWEGVLQMGVNRQRQRRPDRRRRVIHPSQIAGGPLQSLRQQQGATAGPSRRSPSSQQGRTPTRPTNTSGTPSRSPSPISGVRRSAPQQQQGAAAGSSRRSPSPQRGRTPTRPTNTSGTPSRSPSPISGVRRSAPQQQGAAAGSSRRSPSPQRGRSPTRRPAPGTRSTSSGGTVRAASPDGGTIYRQRSPVPGRYRTMRNAGGYINPRHSHGNMLPHWRRAAVSPIRDGMSPREERRHFMHPSRRFKGTSPGRTREIRFQGHANGVLGHEPSASTHWNTIGHRQTRNDNLQHNRQEATYHGIEYRPWSNASGSGEPRYRSPAPDRGSHPSYWNREHRDFQGGPWPTWEEERGRSRSRSRQADDGQRERSRSRPPLA